MNTTIDKSNRHAYKFTYSAVTIAVAILLTACGGGGGGVVRPDTGPGALPPTIPVVPVPDTPVTPDVPVVPAIPTPEYTPSDASMGQAKDHPVMQNTHYKNNVALGTDQARKQGLDGTGVIVGIVDSGINGLDGSDLKDAEIAGKVTLGDRYNAMGNATDGHARKVSAIAAGSISGVASKAKIFMNEGTTDNKIAILEAANAGASVINISLGGKDAGQVNYYTPEDIASTKAAAKAGRPANRRLLDRYGDMLEGLSSQTNANSVRIGFDQPYAVYHEWSTKHMPRRGLLTANPETATLSDTDTQAVMDILQKFLQLS